ncbi:AbrB family transcriptional regulator [Peptococcaceae bacterium SCADC1_2_3]|jgi:transcriptional pleiotropic regulator of transition state genes|nr:AbrB family transcriptional regulator [Peptococcaceae bacterium SCADC1_2_3]KFI34456.1 AbrB family transcriptional regulator [Peptococcaceae bacterium SCADC1_2_3]KFI36653.1 AbrB family transcriptional regulator [Peptococcaceae bacterium SCADC1_2_3]
MRNELMRISAKGQLTIPVYMRKKLNIREGDYLQVQMGEDEIRIKKIKPLQPLSAEDPIWQLIGAGASGQKDVSVNHDRYIVEGEIKQWKG